MSTFGLGLPGTRRYGLESAHLTQFSPPQFRQKIIYSRFNLDRGAAEARSSSPHASSLSIRSVTSVVGCFVSIWCQPPPLATPSEYPSTSTQMRSCQPSKWLDTMDPALTSLLRPYLIVVCSLWGADGGRDEVGPINLPRRVPPHTQFFMV